MYRVCKIESYEFLIRNCKQKQALMPTVAYMQHDLKLKVLKDVLSVDFFPYFYQIPDIVINRNKKNEKKIKIWVLKGLTTEIFSFII